MLQQHEWINHLQSTDSIYSPYVFDRVEVEGKTDTGTPVNFSLVGKCYSEFASGPNLWILANVAGWLFGPGYYGLKSCRKLGWRS